MLYYVKKTNKFFKTEYIIKLINYLKKPVIDSQTLNK